MAVKTITIDLEAYEALAAEKRPGQSFSQVIKQHFGRRRTGRELAELLTTVRLSDSTLDAIEAVVEDRRREPARSVDL
ncbi:MAG TPA: antitoxin VapB family protein [Thermoanaerobaculia bacterium]|nr:antitoxin VapB family protein [Thermoanaerobaculia bacterium]HXT52071.1 antitoxin VapB family protein [Thermoanaerobaculia bacterium]